MGELGRRAAGARASRALTVLARAFADEWCAHYYFRFAALACRGYRAPDLAALLRRKSDAGLRRADRLAERISELGGTPPGKMGALLEAASDKRFKLPRSNENVAGFLRAVLDAERTSVRTYTELHRRCAGDAVTQALALELLRESVAAEDELERLSGDAAPGYDGG